MHPRACPLGLPLLIDVWDIPPNTKEIVALNIARLLDLPVAAFTQTPTWDECRTVDCVYSFQLLPATCHDLQRLRARRVSVRERRVSVRERRR